MTQSRRTQEDRLIKSMYRFFNIRASDGISRINGHLPPKQKEALESIIQQASRLYLYHGHGSDQ